MDWSRRGVVRMLLVGMWTLSLLILAFPARAQAQGGEGSIHVVESGETLSQIARQYGTDVASLLALNGLSNANFVYVGQQLVVAGGGYEEQSQGQRYAPEREERTDYPQGVGWEPQGSDENYHPAGRGWEPEADNAAYQRQGVGYEPEPSQAQESYAGQGWEPQGAARNRPGVGWEPETSDEEESWQPQEDERSQNRAGVGYEPEGSEASYREAGVGREIDATGEKWIDIDLSQQVLTAYQGDTEVRFFAISSGKSSTPTVTGSFRTYARTELQDMSGGSRAAGDYYFQADVPWVQYFFEDYAIHGAYWHNRFGTPVGHGCVNMRVDESQWLYEWAATTGLRVEVHY